MNVNDIFSFHHGMIVAPAGAGKTHKIVECLSTPTNKPYLVLTHTTAGVAALDKRLKSNNIPKKNYKLLTIASWAIKLVQRFPALSGIQYNASVTPNYVGIQFAAANLLSNRHIDSILQANYDRVFVDEYQDCSTSQHSLISALKNILPVTAFGDPMQAIFGFSNDGLPSWDTEVLQELPVIGELDTPWRWNLVGNHELGQWVLSARNILSSGRQIDISQRPSNINWIRLTGNQGVDLNNQTNAIYQLYSFIPQGQSILVIGDSRSAEIRHNFAKRVNGLGVVERVELPDIISAFSLITNSTGVSQLTNALDLLSKMMTGLNKSHLLRRVNTLLNNRSRTEPTELEATAVKVAQENFPESLLELFKITKNLREVRIFRKAALNICIEALSSFACGASQSLNGAIAKAREARRHSGEKRIPLRAIGSTLLLKGLEADHVVILNASPANNGMNAKNLYVALSRGARSITVFSESPILG